MKKRLAKKALSGRYFDIWTKPGVDCKIYVPRNGRCWNIFRRACHYVGCPELIKTVEDNFNKAMDYIESK